MLSLKGPAPQRLQRGSKRVGVIQLASHVLMVDVLQQALVETFHGVIPTIGVGLDLREDT